MRYIRIAAVLVAATAFVTTSPAAVIFHRDDLNHVPSLTMVTFTEIKLDAAKTISDLGQPYKPLGLVLPDQMVDPDADVPGAPGHAAAVSTHIDNTDNATVQTFVFVHPQKALGFNVRDQKATSITVTAYDPSGKAVETTTLKSSRDPQYVGFLRKDQDMVRVMIRAPHASADDAKSSPLEIADVTFAAPYLPGETSMLSPGGRERHEIDGYTAYGNGEIGNFNHSSNLLSYGGDPGSAVSSGSTDGNSTAPDITHSNPQRGVPGAPLDITGSDLPAPLVDNPPTTDAPLAPPPLNSVAHLPEPAITSLLLVPLVMIGLRRRKAKL
jgi:hypothetical protein